jgi:formate hydrogenlyase transcriptional activator
MSSRLRCHRFAERPEDISLLVDYFVDRYAKRAGKVIRRFETRALEQLTAYRWPGNIRELQNIIERAVIVATSHRLHVDDRWVPAMPADSIQCTGTAGRRHS